MMQLVIDIPKEAYDFIKRTGYHTQSLYEAIKNGVPLPKGHGRIVDIGKIDEDRIDHDNPIIYLTIGGEYIEAVSLDYINNLPTIIEADNESEEERHENEV